MKNFKTINLSRRVVQNLALLAILIGLVIFFTSMNPLFFTNRNFVNISRQILPVVIMGCAMTFLINSGAIDLSVGGVMALSAVMFGRFVTLGVGVWLSVFLSFLLGLAVGWLNNFIIHRLNVPSIMATMATWIASSGMAYTICNAIAIQDSRMKPITLLNGTKFFNDTVPLAVFIILFIVSLFLFLEKRTIVGKYALSIGGNEQASLLSGINIPRARLVLFMLCGGMASLAGIWQVSRIGSGEPNIGIGMEFAVIAGCILGGVNIKGGDGTITGMLIGTMTLSILTNGMNMMGVNAFYQQVATGIVILVAVFINYMVGYIRNLTKQKQAA